MAVEIQWISHASFRISGEAGVVYIDPWKIHGKPHDGNVVFVSHSHYDHCSPEDVAKVCASDGAVVAPQETVAKLRGAKAIKPGERLDVSGITIEGVPAYNVGKQFHPKANGWCGCVVEIDGVRVYYAGDTDLIPEMGELKNIDVALLPVGGTYTMNAAEAAQACDKIQPKAAIPYHWGDIVGSKADAEAFKSRAKVTVHVLDPGAVISV